MDQEKGLSCQQMAELGKSMRTTLIETLLILPHNNTGDGLFNLTEMYNVAIAFNTLLLSPVGGIEQLKLDDPIAVEVMKDFCKNMIQTCNQFLEKY